ncbi:Protein of unknown function [Gryllus bimaculatus]|nr:Protein of unknown function [Gryllus bimaculatus]
MAPTHPSTKLAALTLLVLVARGVRGASPQQVVTSLGLHAAAEAMAAMEEGTSHQNEAATVNGLRAALDAGRAALELYAAASDVEPVKPHGLLLTIANAVSFGSDTDTKAKDNTKGNGTGNGGDGGNKGEDSSESNISTLLNMGKQVWQLLQGVR